jgi:large subunit ribosomal protein L24
MIKTRIKKNDEVLVISGRDRGVKGKVLKIFPVQGTAIVERVNMMKRHTRPNPSKQIQGGILEREAPIKLSNLQLVCPECGKPTKTGAKRMKDGTGLRTCKRCSAAFN